MIAFRFSVGIAEFRKNGKKSGKKRKKTIFFKKKGIFFTKNAVFDLTEWILKCIVHILQLKEWKKQMLLEGV